MTVEEKRNTMTRTQKGERAVLIASVTGLLSIGFLGMAGPDVSGWALGAWAAAAIGKWGVTSLVHFK